jgi:hypothetical protein
VVVGGFDRPESEQKDGLAGEVDGPQGQRMEQRERDGFASCHNQHKSCNIEFKLCSTNATEIISEINMNRSTSVDRTANLGTSNL